MCYKYNKKKGKVDFLVPHSPYNIGTEEKTYTSMTSPPEEVTLSVNERKKAAAEHICDKFFLCDVDGIINRDQAFNDAMRYINEMDPLFSNKMFPGGSMENMNWDIVRGSTSDKKQNTDETNEDWGARVALDELKEEAGISVNKEQLEFMGASEGRGGKSRYVYKLTLEEDQITREMNIKFSNPNTAAMGKCPHNYLEKSEIWTADIWRQLKSYYGETDMGLLVKNLNQIVDGNPIVIDRKLEGWYNKETGMIVDLTNKVSGTTEAPSAVSVFVYDRDGNLLLLRGDRGTISEKMENRERKYSGGETKQNKRSKKWRNLRF